KDPDSAIPAANAMLRKIAQPRADAQKVLANPKATPADKTNAQKVMDDTQTDYNNAQETLRVAKEAQQEKVTQAGLKSGAEAAAKTKAEEGGTNGSNLEGQAFLNSLSAGRRNEVMGYINGLNEFSYDGPYQTRRSSSER